MNNSPPQVALREMRRLLASPPVPAGLALLVVLLAISGPFGTLDAMRIAPRLAYWAVTVPATFAAGSFATLVISEALRSHPRRALLTPMLAALGTAIAVAVVVVVLNWLALGLHPLAPSYRRGLLISVLATGAAIALFFHLLRQHQQRDGGETAPDAATDAPADTPADTAPPLLDRLEFDKRGPLVSLSVADHYVEVVTTRGRALLLMRLSDAMRETGATRGMQVHRSHWVALDRIAACRRMGDRAVLTLTDGREIPVSRTYVKPLRDAGILPARG